jgi:MFS family permease
MTFAIVALETLYAFEALGVATAMPTIADALDGVTLYAMAFGATLAASVMGMVAGGLWSDARGAHPPLKAGVACFVLGLLAAGAATDMRIFILGRAAQGLGGGLLSVSLYIVVAQAYPKALHARMFAAFSAAWVVPALVGPMLSGLIVEYLHWRLVFLLVAAGAVIVTPMVLGPVRISSRRHEAQALGLPWASRLGWAIVAAGGALLLHPAIRMEGASGLALCAFAIVLLILACRRLLPAGTLSLARGLPTVVALRGLASAAFFATEALVPLMLSREHGFAPAQAGMALTLGAVGWSLGSWLRSRANACESVQVLRIGLALLLAGTLATATAAWPDAPVAIALCGWAAAGLGMGLTRPTLAVLTLELAPAGRQGVSASALQLCDALFTSSVLAMGGAVIAAWLTTAPTRTYASALAISGLLALVALAAAGRTRPGTRSRRR